MSALPRYRIKDLSQAEWGRSEVGLAEREMPGLMALRAKYGGSKPLSGARITGSLHMTLQTAVLIETLADLGADLRWCSCNIFSTQDHAAAAVVAGRGNGAAAPGGLPVFAWKEETLDEYWELLDLALAFPSDSGDSSQAPVRGPNLIVDDGGDATLMFHLGVQAERNPELLERAAGSEDEAALLRRLKAIRASDPTRWSRAAKDLVGVSEETTTGVHRLYRMEKGGGLLIPAINVNDSVTKSKFDNLYGCRESLLDGIKRATGVMIAGKVAVVAGFGDVGKGCAQSFARHGRAGGGIRDGSHLRPASGHGRLCRGPPRGAPRRGGHLRHRHRLRRRRRGPATRPDEGRRHGLQHRPFRPRDRRRGAQEDTGVKKLNVKPQVDRWVFPDGREIILLAEGRLVNLGCAQGHPSFVMSASFTNQVLAQIELWEHREGAGPGVRVLPRRLDEEVARLHLDKLGARLGRLSEAQAEYLGLEVDGPFKGDAYRY